MKRQTLLTVMILLLSLVVFFSCSSADTDPISVGSLAISKIVINEQSSSAASAPVSYDVTITWNTDDIIASDTASTAISGLKVYLQSGTTTVTTEDLAVDATTYTFKGLLPGDSLDLRVEAVYAEGTYEDASWDDYTASLDFIGGPWYDGTNKTLPLVERFSIGSFNNVDSIPASYSLDDVYYYNPYNTNYLFSSVSDEKWWIVDANEVTTSNDTTEQRNNVMWLRNNFYLLDSNTAGLSSYADMANVDVAIYDINGHELLSLSGSSVSGTMSTTNWDYLLNSIDSGYYEDKTGCFFIKATCKSMPSSYSTSNTSNLGYWGFAIVGSRR